MANPNLFDPEHVRQKRTFPVGNAIGFAALIIVQLVLILLIFVVRFEPEDRISHYSVDVTPLSDGTLDIEYAFTWLPLKQGEPLRWVEIGMANGYFTIDPSSLSSNISSATADVGEDDDGNTYAYVHISFNRPYNADESFEFSFRVRQEKMLCKNADGYFYEFVPGWFNSIPVDAYEFRWHAEGGTADASLQKGDYVWNGSLDCGGHVFMKVSYPSTAFPGAATVEYQKFSGNTQNDLKTDRIGFIISMTLIIFGLGFAEVWMADSFVSYSRGRGFICRYGYNVHLYGRVNPKYQQENEKRMAARGGGHGGGHGGCACACACACAGGGRAGCSQKDTTSVSAHDKE